MLAATISSLLPTVAPSSWPPAEFIAALHWLKTSAKVHCILQSTTQETMEQYRALVAELEVLLPPQLGSRKQQQDGGKTPAALAALPVVLHNLHDFFNHVAARLEKLHDGVASAREAFLERRREVGCMQCDLIASISPQLEPLCILVLWAAMRAAFLERWREVSQ